MLVKSRMNEGIFVSNMLKYDDKQEARMESTNKNPKYEVRNEHITRQPTLRRWRVLQRHLSSP